MRLKPGILKVNPNLNNAALFIILLCGSILRFYDFNTIPFTHDEFSALFRTQFNSFSELIEKGVMVDGHPAGVQVFLFYWIKIWGWSEPLIKLPFIISGIISIWVFYLIGKAWYNETVALISTAFFSSIQYTVMHSQIARPYASGLLFCLLLVYFWTRLIKYPEKKFNRNLIWYTILASLCVYNHYFSLLFAIIVNICGLFFIKKPYLKKYMISWIVCVILFIPHLQIFLHQLSLGGIGDWLGKPGPEFIVNYISYIFQFSGFIFAIVVFIFIYGLKGFKSKNFNKPYFFLASGLFLIPFLIGYFYSIVIESVLHYAVLYFSFPFLFFILFGHIQQKNQWINLSLVIIILSVNTWILVNKRKHFQLFYNSPYIGILEDYKKNKAHAFKILSIIDSHPKISAFYLSRNHISTDFFYYTELNNQYGLTDFLKKNKDRYDELYFGCLSSSDSRIVPQIMEYYPFIKQQKNYAGGTSYLFSKKSGEKSRKVEYNNFEKDNLFWTNLEQKKKIYVDSLNFGLSYLIDSLTEWSPTYCRNLEQITENSKGIIDISLMVNLPDPNCNALLVSCFIKNEQIVFWDGTELGKQGRNKIQNSWFKVHQSIKIPDKNLNYSKLKLKIYIWNINKKNIIIDDLNINSRKGNPLIYGLIEKI